MKDIGLLHTWENSVQLDDREIANEAAKYCRKYPLEYLLYSRRTSGAVAARFQPAGIPIFDMDSVYPQSCDELLGAINSGRLRHRGQSDLTKQILSAVQLKRGDGGWVIGRRASQAAVCAAVATALVTHFATRPWGSQALPIRKHPQATVRQAYLSTSTNKSLLDSI